MVLCGVVGGMNVVVAVIVCIDVNDDEVDETDIAGLVCSDDEVDSIVVVVTVGVKEAFGIKYISAFMYYSDIN